MLIESVLAFEVGAAASRIFRRAIWEGRRLSARTTALPSAGPPVGCTRGQSRGEGDPAAGTQRVLRCSTHHVLGQAGEEALVESFCRDLFDFLFSLEHSGYKDKTPVQTALSRASSLAGWRRIYRCQCKERKTMTATPLPLPETCQALYLGNSVPPHCRSLRAPCHCCYSHFVSENTKQRSSKSPPTKQWS